MESNIYGFHQIVLEVVPMSDSHEPSPTCSFIKATGTLCQALALTGNRYCYAHSRANQRRQIVRHMLGARRHYVFNQDDAKPPVTPAFDDLSAKLLESLDLPDVEDITTLNVNLNAIAASIRSQQISRADASLLLRACRLQANIIDTLKFEARMAQRDSEEFAASDPDPLRDPYCESVGMDQVVASEDARRARQVANSRAEAEGSNSTLP